MKKLLATLLFCSFSQITPAQAETVKFKAALGYIQEVFDPNDNSTTWIAPDSKLEPIAIDLRKETANSQPSGSTILEQEVAGTLMQALIIATRFPGEIRLSTQVSVQILNSSDSEQHSAGFLRVRDGNSINGWGVQGPWSGTDDLFLKVSPLLVVDDINAPSNGESPFKNLLNYFK